MHQLQPLFSFTLFLTSLFFLDHFSEELLEKIGINIPEENQDARVESNDIPGSASEDEQSYSSDSTIENITSRFQAAALAHSPPRTPERQQKESFECNFGDDKMKIEWDVIRDLPHPSLADTRREVLMGSIKLEGGIDLDSFMVVYDPFRHKLQASWKMIDDMQYAQARFQHMVTGNNIYAYSVISAVQARLDKEFSDSNALQRTQEFDLPAGIKVESSPIDLQTFRPIDDPVILTSTQTDEGNCLDGFFSTIFMLIVNKQQATPNLRRYGNRNRTINGQMRTGGNRGNNIPDFVPTGGSVGTSNF